MFSRILLARARDRRGLTRSQLHEELILVGVRRCRALIDHWERGRSEPRASELEGLARVLRVPLADFFEPTETVAAPE